MKNRYTKLRLLLASALVAVFASVFLFGQNVHAQELDVREPIKLDILIADPMLEEQSRLVFEKLTEVEKETKEQEELDNIKNGLDTEVKSLEQQIAELKQKIAEKRERQAREVREAAEAAERAREARIAQAQTAISIQPSYSTAGNTYGYGYCTWYVKNVASWIPNGLGNANTWYYRAQSFGLSTGTTPRAGAVGTTERGSLGHVVYVRAVHGDGTITISEMNYAGWNVVSSRTANASEFRYIYPN